MRPSRRLRGVCGLVGWLFVLVSLIPDAASRPVHTSVRTAEPAPSAVVPAPVDEVTLTFFGPVNGATISMAGPDGQAIEPKGPPERSADGLRVQQRFEPAQALGTYEVDYLIDNEDGFAQPGAYVFQVAAASKESRWGLVVVAVGAVVLLIGLVAGRLRHRRKA